MPTAIKHRSLRAAFKTGICLTSITLLSACGAGATPGNQAAVDPIHTADLNDVQSLLSVQDSAAISVWSDPASWSGGVPAEGVAVTIPKGRTVFLDTHIAPASLTVNGSLICSDKDVAITTRWIMVHGLMQCGSATSPHQHRLDITLTGSDKSESVMGMGTKVLAAMGGGVIALFGQERESWLMLNQTVKPGDISIQLDQKSNWRAGDEIVISSTDDNMEHAEVRTIKSVDGNRIKLTNPLQFRHFGQIQSFSNATRSWQLDTRAEVGLLTRNIRIRGDDQSEANRFGGHVMIMEGAVGLISGVEFYQMGQEGILGRYPFHWHLANNVKGQFIRNSSIRRSYNRCVTVHGSHNAAVEDNVCYDHIGHGYFLEDGSETNNSFVHNLGLVTRRPSAEVALIPSDIQNGEASRGPSTFWISNPNNTFTHNAAAGSDGLGFWYDTEEKVTGASAGLQRYQGVVPMIAPFGEFKHNRVHSSNMAFSSCSESAGPAGYLPPETAVYRDLTVFAGGDGAVWPCEGDQVFAELKIADTGHAHHAGFVAPRPVSIRDSIFIANSALSDGGRGRSRSAIGIYDFGVDLVNVHFVNFNREYGGNYIFGARDADVRFTNNPIKNITLSDSQMYYDRRNAALDMRPSAWGALIHDEDGSFGLAGVAALVADHPMMTDSTCTDTYGSGRLCGNRYGRVELDFGGKQNLPAMTHLRSDGQRVVAKPLGERAHYQSVVSVNHSRYHYGYEFDSSVLSERNLLLSLDFLHNGDTVVLEFPNFPANAVVMGSGYAAASSEQALLHGNGRQFYHSGGSLFLKLRAEGPRWNASDRVNITW